MRMRPFVAGAAVVLAVAGAPGVVETRQQAPTAAELDQVRAAIAEYRKSWTSEFDAETRGLAQKYGAPTPDDLERMLRGWQAGGKMPSVPSKLSIPSMPAGVLGNLGDLFGRIASSRALGNRLVPDNKAPEPKASDKVADSVRSGPPKPGEEAPDFADGAPREALDALKDAKVNLDDIRDKHAETATCSPQALSAKQTLEVKLQAYRKALTDMEGARQQVARENLAGEFMEVSALGAGANAAVKATADAAMELFGAANSALLGNNKGVAAIGAVYNVAGGVASAFTADNDLGAASGLITTQANITKLQAMTINEKAAKPLNVAVTAAELLAKSLDTAALRSEKSPEGAIQRQFEVAGNAAQMAGTLMGTAAELGAVDLLKPAGANLALYGTAASTAIKYDRELGEALDQVLVGQDERRQYDTLNESTLQRNAGKRIEFMEKIAALEAEIGRSNCVQ